MEVCNARFASQVYQAWPQLPHSSLIAQKLNDGEKDLGGTRSWSRCYKLKLDEQKFDDTT